MRLAWRSKLRSSRQRRCVRDVIVRTHRTDNTRSRRDGYGWSSDTRHPRGIGLLDSVHFPGRRTGSREGEPGRRVEVCHGPRQSGRGREMVCPRGQAALHAVAWLRAGGQRHDSRAGRLGQPGLWRRNREGAAQFRRQRLVQKAGRDSTVLCWPPRVPGHHRSEPLCEGVDRRTLPGRTQRTAGGSGVRHYARCRARQSRDHYDPGRLEAAMGGRFVVRLFVAGRLHGCRLGRHMGTRFDRGQARLLAERPVRSPRPVEVELHRRRDAQRKGRGGRRGEG